MPEQQPPVVQPVETTPPSTPTPQMEPPVVQPKSRITLIVVIVCGALVVAAIMAAFLLPVSRDFILSKFSHVIPESFVNQSKKTEFTWVPLTDALDSPYASDGISAISYIENENGRPVIGVDQSTFEVLSYKDTVATTTKYTNFARDTNQVYYKEKKIVDADPSTFVVLPFVNEADNYIYAKDATRVFFGDTSIVGADPESFAPLYKVNSQFDEYLEYTEYSELTTTYYAKDKNYVYSNSKIIPSLDPATVTLVGSFVKDAKAVFGTTEKVDAATFVSLGEEFYKDKDNYYCYGMLPLRVRDPATFTSLEHNFAKDAQALYSASFCGALPNSDPATFEIIDDYKSGYAKDSRNVYSRGMIVQNINPASFSIANKYYIKDDTKVYYVGYGTPTLIKDADSKTFTTFGPDSLYAGDQIRRYYSGRPIEGVLISSFLVLNAGYAKDGKQVYYNGKVIKDADPITFVASSTNKIAAKDKRGDYLYGRFYQSEESTSLLIVEYINKVRAQGYSDTAIRDELKRQGIAATSIDKAFIAAGSPTTSAGAANTASYKDASEYIRQSRMSGYTDTQIKTALLTAGWSESQTNQAFAYTPKPNQILDKNGNASVFYKDDTYVYCGGVVNDPSNLSHNGLTLLTILKGADVKTFTLITDSSGAATPFGKDVNSVFQRYTNGCEASATAFSKSGYFQFTPDAATFRYVGGTDKNSAYYRDQTRLYNWGGLFLSPVYATFGAIDLATFETFTSVQGTSSTRYDAQDKDHKYYRGRQLK